MDEDSELLDWGTGLRRENRGWGEHRRGVAATESGDLGGGEGKKQGQAWDWWALSPAGFWER